MPKKRFKIKDIVTRNIHGHMTNYGPLMVGYLNGIECLAHREVLLLLGIKLGHGVRQPRDFYNELELRVEVAGIEVVVYVTRRVTIDTFGCKLSKRGFPVYALAGWSQDPVKRWSHGVLIEDKFPIEQPSPIRHPLYQQDTNHTRPGMWKRFRRAVKRLFIKQRSSS